MAEIGKDSLLSIFEAENFKNEEIQNLFSKDSLKSGKLCPGKMKCFMSNS